MCGMGYKRVGGAGESVFFLFLVLALPHSSESAKWYSALFPSVYNTPSAPSDLAIRSPFAPPTFRRLHPPPHVSYEMLLQVVLAILSAAQPVGDTSSRLPCLPPPPPPRVLTISAAPVLLTLPAPPTPLPTSTSSPLVSTPTSTTEVVHASKAISSKRIARYCTT